MRRPFRIFVTATDTGVGKTEAACALLELLAERGERPAAFKPYESGCARLAQPADALALRRAAGSDDALERICPHRFRAPLAPGVAARRRGHEPSFARTLEAFASFAERSLVAEGAGGLLVPIDSRRDVIDLVTAFALPVLLVARAGLGTLNHTRLSLEALRLRRARVAAVLLVKGTPKEDRAELDNARVLAERANVLVLGPVPYTRASAARRGAFKAALAPLLPPRR